MFPAYDLVGPGKACVTSSIYTYTGDSSCDGWAGVSLEECKMYCSENAIPTDQCPKQKQVCSYFKYNRVSQNCHLCDSSMVLLDSPNEDVYMREGNCFFFVYDISVQWIEHFVSPYKSLSFIWKS